MPLVGGGYFEKGVHPQCLYQAIIGKGLRNEGSCNTIGGAVKVLFSLLMKVLTLFEDGAGGPTKLGWLA